MYLWRRGGRYWFRKTVPLDLAGILGRAEVRCSLHTSERAIAQKRALAMQVALEQVYEVLRSERPLGATKRLLGTFLEDFRANGGGSDVGLHSAYGGLRNAVAELGAPALPVPAGSDQTLVPVDAIDAILREQQPRGEANQAAGELLQLALAIRREKSWSRPERAKALVRLCQKLVAVSEDKSFGSPQGWAAVREIIREEIASAGIGTTINQSPPIDLEAFREIVATEVRSGVNNAGRDRWSDELLSKKVDEFLALKSTQDVSLKPLRGLFAKDRSDFNSLHEKRQRMNQYQTKHWRFDQRRGKVGVAGPAATAGLSPIKPPVQFHSLLDDEYCFYAS